MHQNGVGRHLDRLLLRLGTRHLSTGSAETSLGPRQKRAYGVI
jgi:hypothetical protein